MPVNTGGRGKEQLRRFYRDVFIPSWPDDLQMTLTNRVLGDSAARRGAAPALHPQQANGLVPARRAADRTGWWTSTLVVVVQFRGDKLACERIYWDQATVLRQVGLL